MTLAPENEFAVVAYLERIARALENIQMLMEKGKEAKE